MLAGVLELQLLAEMGRLTTDMRRAERVVQDSTDRMGKSVAGLESAFGKLGSTLSLGIAFDQIRRMTDDFTKLNAQLKIATHSQAEYTAGLADVRRISTAAQADILSTTLLYTRLTNALSQHGATQKQVSNVTEAVSLGLKAYGATATEASSAMLQLSQAFGANRLGGEEFRAVSEAMPNMMKILAESMGKPLSALKALSAEGKITSEAMMKAWDNPTVIEALRKQADMTRTITGEIVVFRNNLKMLVGEFMDSSKGTQGITSALHLMSEGVKLLAENMAQLVSAATALSVLYAGKLLLALKAKIQVMWSYNEAVGMNNAADKARAGVAAAVSEQIAAAKQLEIYAEREAFIANQARTKALLAGALAADARVVAEERLAGMTARVAAAEVEAIATERALGIARTTAIAATEARAAAEIGALAKVGNFIKGMVGGTLGLIGLALWGAYEIADHMGWIDKVFNKAEESMKRIKGMVGEGGGAALAEAVALVAGREAAAAARAAQNKALAAAGITVGMGVDASEALIAIRIAELEKLTKAGSYMANSSLENMKVLKTELAVLKELQNVPRGEKVIKTPAAETNYDLEFLTKSMHALQKQRDDFSISEAQYAAGIKKIYEELQPKKDKAAAKELNAYEQATLKANERIAVLNAEINGNSKLLQSEKDIEEFRVAQRAGLTKMDALHQAEHLTRLEAIKIQEQTLAADALQVSAMEKINTAGTRDIDRLDKAIAAQKLHNDSISKTAEQIAALQAAVEAKTLADMVAEAQSIRESQTNDAVTLTRLANLDALIKREQEFKNLKDAAPALEAIKAFDHEQKKLAESFTKHFNDAFTKVFDSGKSMFSLLSDAVKNSFKDVLSAFNKPMLDKFSTTGASVVQNLSRSPMIASAMPYVAAAMLALPMIGGLFSHQATAQQMNQIDPKFIQQWQGTGTVLGDISAKSTSVVTGMDTLNKTTFAHTDYLTQMTASMRSVDKGINNFITVAGKALNLNMASQTPLGTTTTQTLSGGANFLLSAGVGALVTPIVTEALLSAAIMGTMGTMATDVAMTALGASMGVLTMGVGLVISPIIGSLLGGLFGSSSTSITGTGIQFGGTTKQLQQGQGGQQYTSGVTTSESFWGMFSSSSTWTQYSALDAKVTKAMGDIFKNIGDTISVAAVMLGGNAVAITKQLDAFVIATGQVSMAGMSVQQQQQALSDIVSKQSDLMVAAVVPTMKAFQVAGEGLLQTLIRVVSEVATLTAFHTALGDATVVTAASADKLITALGGVDAANQTMTKFVSNFAPEVTKSALALNALDVALKNAGLAGVAPLIKTTQDYFALMQVANADQRVILLQQQDTALAYIKTVGSAMNLMLDQASKYANTAKNELGFVITNLSSLAQSLKGAANSLYQSFMQQMTPDYQRQQYKASLALLQDAYTNYKATGVAPNAAGLQQAISTVSQGGTQMFASATDYRRSTMQTIDLLSGMGNLADAQVTVLTQISSTMDKLLAAQQEQLAATNAGNIAAAADAANRAVALSVNLQWLQGVNALVTNSAAQNTLVIDLVKQTVSATTAGGSALIDTLQKYITSAGTTMVGSGATTGLFGATSSGGGVLPTGTAAGALNQVSGMGALGGFASSGVLGTSTPNNPLTAMLAGVPAANMAAAVAAATAAAQAIPVYSASNPNPDNVAAKAAALAAWQKAQSIPQPKISFINADARSNSQSRLNTWQTNIATAKSAYDALPSFAVGTNALTNDGPIFAHAGEEIKPAAYVDKDKAARMETNALLARLVASNDASRTELVSVRKELADIRRTNQNIDWTTDKWDNDGMPDIRQEVTSG